MPFRHDNGLLPNDAQQTHSKQNLWREMTLRDSSDCRTFSRKQINQLTPVSCNENPANSTKKSRYNFSQRSPSYLQRLKSIREERTKWSWSALQTRRFKMTDELNHRLERVIDPEDHLIGINCTAPVDPTLTPAESKDAVPSLLTIGIVAVGLALVITCFYYRKFFINLTYI